MQTLFDGELHTDYSQIHVMSGPETEGDLTTAFAGQVNGLCGGASPGFLYLITGLYYGRVGFTVEMHDESPPVNESWEEIVEVSFNPSTETLDVVELFRGSACSLVVPLVVRTTGSPQIEFPRNVDPQFAALPAIFAAVQADPLTAAVDALYAAAVTFGDEHQRLLSELRSAFPVVA